MRFLLLLAGATAASAFSPKGGKATRVLLAAPGTVIEPKVIFENKAGVTLDRETKQLLARAEDVGVRRVNALEADVEALTLGALRERVGELRLRMGALAIDVEPSDNDVADVFALVREAAWRVLGLRAYDVQMLGGYAMSTGALVEMATGEGKTLAAIAPTVLAALRGRGALVVTANDYLARRDADSVGQVVRYLGLTVGLIESTLKPGSNQRREGYAADVTYVSNQELGFDYLRDQLALDNEELVLPQRDYGKGNSLFYWCLVDEADSILIDEARTPLIISEQTASPAAKYTVAKELVEIFREGVHYDTDDKAMSVTLTERGFTEAESAIGKSIWDPTDPWAPFIVSAVRAKALLQRDRDYIVDEAKGTVSIVDAFSGRVLEGRRWSDGLQQAVEAKEAIPPSSQTRPAALVTFQSLFRNVATKLAGMTGTALTDSAEFEGVYKLKVVPIPTALPIGRKDYDDAVYRTVEAKLRATAAEVARAHQSGRPVLVGTTSVEDSDAFVQRLFEDYGIEATSLNARPDVAARESAIVAQAGRLGAVTVATNMAGRGTDIVLGGNAKDLAKMCVENTLLIGRMDNFAEENGFEDPLTPETASLLETARQLAMEQLGTEGVLSPEDAKDLVALAAEQSPTSNAIVGAARKALEALKDEIAPILKEEREKVVEAGGLYVIGTQRHESRRIDAQLRGRSGRQGDPGATRFFVSLEDRIFRTFGGDRLESLMRNFRIGDDLPLEAKSVTEALTSVQERVEIYNADIRDGVLRFDDVLDMQRKATYATRRRLLLATDDASEAILREWTEAAATAVVQSVKRDSTSEASSTMLGERMASFFGAQAAFSALDAEKVVAYDGIEPTLAATLEEVLSAKLDAIALSRPQRSPQRSFSVLALMRTDTQWAQHLTNMDYLKDSVQLRIYAQQDPFQAFVLEGNELFEAFNKKIKTDTVYSFFQLS